MPDTKITALTALTAADPANDVLPIVDVSDTTMAASGTTKKISINNVLGCSGTATLASATITGDLTVDTNTLKVDSANDRVGIGTASPAQFVHLSKSNTSTALTAPPVGGASLRIQNSSSTNNNFGSVEFYNAAGLFGGSVNCQFTNQATPTNDLVFVTRGSSGGLEHYRIAADGVCTWSEVGGVAGTAMTLNSTGLGVGVSPTTKLDVLGSGDGELRLRAGSDAALIFSETAANKNWKLKPSGGDFQFQYSATAYNSGYSPLMYLTATGNLGIGVASPAFKLSAAGVSQFYADADGIYASGNSSPDLYTIGVNYYNAAGTEGVKVSARPSWKIEHKNSSDALAYLDIGFRAASAAASAFTSRFKIDGSGNVGIGVTSPAAKLHVEGSGPQARFSVATAVDARHEYYRNGIREGLIYWDANLIGLYATQSSGELVLASANTIRVRINSAGDTISNVTATPPTLSTNRQMVFNLTSDTNLRISVRGSDGTTRTANITLA